MVCFTAAGQRGSTGCFCPQQKCYTELFLRHTHQQQLLVPGVRFHTAATPHTLLTLLIQSESERCAVWQEAHWVDQISLCNDETFDCITRTQPCLFSQRLPSFNCSVQSLSFSNMLIISKMFIKRTVLNYLDLKVTRKHKGNTVVKNKKVKWWRDKGRIKVKKDFKQTNKQTYK